MLKIFSFVNAGERAGSGMGTIESDWTADGYPAPTYEVAYGPDHTTLTQPLVSADSTGEDRQKRQRLGKIGDHSPPFAVGADEEGGTRGRYGPRDVKG